MHKDADRIRNVALVGQRGSGKTSLHEALLYQAGVTSRLGSVDAGTTVSDSDPGERARRMSISASVSAFPWMERWVNLIDTPGEPSFIADVLGGLSVCESAIFVVNAVTGVEGQTVRLWQRAAERDLARLVFINMLDRERADFFRVLGQLQDAFGPQVVATEIPIGSEQEVRGVIDLIAMRAFEFPSEQSAAQSAATVPIPDSHADLAREYREKLMDAVAENSDQLLERYLDGDEIDPDEIISVLKAGTNHGQMFPVTCGIATANLGTTGLLAAIVDDLPSPVEHGGLTSLDLALDPADDRPGAAFAYAFKTRADPFAGRLNLFRVFQGVVRRDSQLFNTRAHVKERVGQLLRYEGSDRPVQVDELGPGDIGAVAKLKETHSGDWLADHDAPIELPQVHLPAPVMAFAIEPADIGSDRGRGAHGAANDDKLALALRRLTEEDPAIDVHRDAQTGERLIAGLSPLHVEVVVERLRERFGIEVTLKPPRVPYQETIRRPASAHGRHKKQTGGRGQFGDCHITIEPLEPDDGLDDLAFVNAIKGGAIPSSFIPAVEKGIREAMEAGPLAGFPLKGVKVTLIDGAVHSVDSSEMAFKLAGALAMRKAMADADPVLLEPIMLASITVPEETVGEVIGDLNARRGRPLGMTPAGHTTEVKAEVPLAEMVSYASNLRALTSGQGEYTMEFLGYEPVPDHLKAGVVAGASAAREHDRPLSGSRSSTI